MRVVLVEDHRLMREALVGELTSFDDITLVGTCADGETAVELVLRERPDVVVMDLRLPVVDGVEATRRILGAWPQARVLAHTADPGSDQARAALDAGAAAVVGKGTDSALLVRALRYAARCG